MQQSFFIRQAASCDVLCSNDVNFCRFHRKCVATIAVTSFIYSNGLVADVFNLFPCESYKSLFFPDYSSDLDKT